MVIHDAYPAIAKQIDRWKHIAAYEVDDIACWRAAPHEKGYRADWEPPKGFFSLTQSLVAYITKHYPQLDPKPLMVVYTQVQKWYDDHNADQILDQAVLERTTDLAVMTINSVWRDAVPDEVDDQEAAQADGPWTRPMTYTEIGKHFGISRNRVRKHILEGRKTKKMGRRTCMLVSEMPADYQAKIAHIAK